MMKSKVMKETKQLTSTKIKNNLQSSGKNQYQAPYNTSNLILEHVSLTPLIYNISTPMSYVIK